MPTQFLYGAHVYGTRTLSAVKHGALNGVFGERRLRSLNTPAPSRTTLLLHPKESAVVGVWVNVSTLIIPDAPITMLRFLDYAEELDKVVWRTGAEREALERHYAAARIFAETAEGEVIPRKTLVRAMR